MSIKKHKLWRDGNVLEYLYWDKEMSEAEIASRLGCSTTTVTKWRDKNDIPSRDYPWLRETHKSLRVERANFHTDDSGYERWESTYQGDSSRVRVHRMLAVAEYGFDRVCENLVHHKNGIYWDNRPSNIEIMSPTDHAKLHTEERDRNSKGQFA